MVVYPVAEYAVECYAGVYGALKWPLSLPVAPHTAALVGAVWCSLQWSCPELMMLVLLLHVLLRSALVGELKCVESGPLR